MKQVNNEETIIVLKIITDKDMTTEDNNAGAISFIIFL